eukprot:15040245-Alexandrium_andersonii.AAC.1
MKRHRQKLEPPALDLRKTAPAVGEEHLAGVRRNSVHHARRVLDALRNPDLAPQRATHWSSDEEVEAPGLHQVGP